MPPTGPPPRGGGAWDCHCHVLPGLDDGPPDLETAVAMVRLAAATGTGTIITTPHAIDGLYPNTRDRVLPRLEELRARCAAEGLAVKLLPGQEVALVPDLAARLKAGELLTLGDAGRAVLVELPLHGVPVYWSQAFFELALERVVPIIAHVERTPLLRDEAVAAAMVAAGARMQVNVTALRPGSRTERLLARWLERGWVVCLGSDAHDLEHRPPVLRPAGGPGPSAGWLELMHRRPEFVPN